MHPNSVPYRGRGSVTRLTWPPVPPRPLAEGWSMGVRGLSSGSHTQETPLPRATSTTPHPVPVLTSWESAGSDLTLGEPQSPSRGKWLPLNVTSAWDSIQKTSQAENNSKTNAPQQFHSQPTLGMKTRGIVSYCLLLLPLLLLLQ